METKEYNGLCVSPGAVVGKAHVITRSVSSGRPVKGDEILILEYGEPTYSMDVMNAAGLVCENGGRLSHICIVAMEMGIPCLTQVQSITRELTDGMYVSLDATNGKLYVMEE